MQLEQDFSLVFPEQSSKFLEKWPTISPKVVKLAGQLNNDTVTMLMGMLDDKEAFEEARRVGESIPRAVNPFLPALTLPPNPIFLVMIRIFLNQG